jgi:hypothetical protein
MGNFALDEILQKSFFSHLCEKHIEMREEKKTFDNFSSSSSSFNQHLNIFQSIFDIIKHLFSMFEQEEKKIVLFISLKNPFMEIFLQREIPELESFS